MSGTYRKQAEEKLAKEIKAVNGQKEAAMKNAVRDQLLFFCGQDEEFAQAIVQGGNFGDCMKAVAKGVGTSISDLEAYTKAVQFYFPGARIRTRMTIDLIGAAAEGPEEKPEEEKAPAAEEKPAGIVLDLTDFL